MHSRQQNKKLIVHHVNDGLETSHLPVWRPTRKQKSFKEFKGFLHVPKGGGREKEAQ
jgi:hypothetical protein